MTGRRRVRRRFAVVIGGLVFGGASVATALAPTGWSPRAVALSLLPVPDTLTMRHDRTATVPPPGVLGNDVGLGGGATAVLDAPPSHGEVDLRPDGGYTYEPDAGYVGLDKFLYHPTGLVVISTSVTITITNASPIAHDDAYDAITGEPLVVPAPGVLANDDDADGDGLRASLVDGGGNGSLSLSADGGFSFKSGGSFTGLRTFTYRVTDGVDSSGVATVSIDVREAAATPTPTPKLTPPPSATPTPTPRPTPRPTDILPLPSISIPPLPLPTRSPAPTPEPSGSPGETRPPGPSSSADATGTPPASSSSTPRPDAGQSGPPAGAGPGGGPTSSDDGLFSVGRGGLGPIDALVDVDLVGFDGMIEWAVPAVVLGVPGLLLLLAVLAQAAGGLLWLPMVRRGLGGFGFRRRRSSGGAPH